MPDTDIFGKKDNPADDELIANELSVDSDKPYTPTVAVGIVGVTNVQAQGNTLPAKP